jgi:hypothetical protein
MSVDGRICDFRGCRFEAGHAGRHGYLQTYCEAYARKGTGTGTCGRPLNRHGNCDRASSHVDAP